MEVEEFNRMFRMLKSWKLLRQMGHWLIDSNHERSIDFSRLKDAGFLLEQWCADIQNDPILLQSCFFFNITPFLPWAILLKVQVPKSISNENYATNFKARTCKICHILHNVYTTGIRIGTLHCTVITAGLKMWKRTIPSGIKQVRVDAAFGEQLFRPCSSSFPTPGKVVE